MYYANVSFKQAKEMTGFVAGKVAVQPKTARDLLGHRRAPSLNHCSYVLTGLPPLDDALGGNGFPTGSITEICGGPGVGKTQLCLRACVECVIDKALPGDVLFTDEKIVVVYFRMGGNCFPTERFQMIATNAYPDVFAQHDRRAHEYRQEKLRGAHEDQQRKSGGLDDFVPEPMPYRPESLGTDGLLNSVLVIEPISNTAFLKSLDNLLRGRLMASGVRLIVVDSLVAFCQGMDFYEAETAAFLCEASVALLRIASVFGCAVLVTTQVKAVVFYPKTSSLEEGGGDDVQLDEKDMLLDGGNRVRSVCGLDWQHTTTTRILMSTTAGKKCPTNGGNAEHHPARILLIDKSFGSAHTPLSCPILYDIGPEGLVSWVNPAPRNSFDLGTGREMDLYIGEDYDFDNYPGDFYGGLVVAETHGTADRHVRLGNFDHLDGGGLAELVDYGHPYDHSVEDQARALGYPRR